MHSPGLNTLIYHSYYSCRCVLSAVAVNVALGKTYSHSSAYLPNEPNLNNTTNPASYAANGNTDGTYDTTNCIHTVNSDNNDWWQVDLGAEYSLYNFKVWGRDNCE